jgi:hypothetical protein
MKELLSHAFAKEVIMKELLSYALMFVAGGAAFGVAYKTYNRWRSDAWRDGFASGKQVVYDYVLTYADTGKPWKFKWHDSEYAVTVKSEEVKG